jgi:Kdo2-lipid IVA lauroyltransferase/acyltransferase
MKKVRYFFEYLILLFFYKIISCIGIDAASSFGGFVARWLGPLLSASKVARRNIDFVFPKLSNESKKKMIVDMWDNLGRTITELPYIHTMSDEEFYTRVKVVTNNIKKLDNKRATICLSGHFANWETGARALVPFNNKISIIYRDNNNQLINDQYLAMRNNRFENIAKGQSGAKNIIRAVHNKHFVCFLQDQKLNQGLEVNLFGKPAMTAKASASLALKFGLPFLLVHSVRTKGANFKVHVDGPYEIKDLIKNIDEYKTLEEREIVLTQKINYVIEGWVKDNPAQWFWVHRRWEKAVLFR